MIYDLTLFANYQPEESPWYISKERSGSLVSHSLSERTARVAPLVNSNTSAIVRRLSSWCLSGIQVCERVLVGSNSIMSVLVSIIGYKLERLMPDSCAINRCDLVE